MTCYCARLVLLTSLSFGLVIPGIAFAAGLAQAPQTSSTTAKSDAAPPKVTAGVPVQVEIRLVRVKDGKEVGSLPYLMSLVAASGEELDVYRFLTGQSTFPRSASIRAGVTVPIPSAGSSGDPATYAYRNVGTNIDCTVVRAPDGRFAMRVSISDSSLYIAPGASAPAANVAAPILNSFEALSVFTVTANEKREFLVATDRINGETVRAELTLRVVK